MNPTVTPPFSSRDGSHPIGVVVTGLAVLDCPLYPREFAIQKKIQADRQCNLVDKDASPFFCLTREEPIDSPPSLRVSNPPPNDRIP